MDRNLQTREKTALCGRWKCIRFFAYFSPSFGLYRELLVRNGLQCFCFHMHVLCKCVCMQISGESSCDDLYSGIPILLRIHTTMAHMRQ